jgi:hypothetical protein
LFLRDAINEDYAAYGELAPAAGGAPPAIPPRIAHTDLRFA